MRRCLLINILLIVAGILLALALFGAGVVWKSRMKSSRPSVPASAAEKSAAGPPATLLRRKGRLKEEEAAWTFPPS